MDFEQREGHFAAVVLSKIKLPLIARRGAAVSVTAGSRCKSFARGHVSWARALKGGHASRFGLAVKSRWLESKRTTVGSIPCHGSPLTLSLP